MKSIFNFRPLFIIFLGFILGVVYYVSIANIREKYWLGLFIVLTILLVVMIYVILGLLHKKSKIMSYMHSTYHVWLTLFVSIIVFGAIFSMAIAIKNHRLVDITDKVSFSGTITQAEVNDTYVDVELRDVVYDDTKLHSNLRLIIYTKGSSLDYSVGNIVSASGYINKTSIDNYNVYNYSAIYTTKLSESNITISDGNPNAFEWFKLKTKSLLIDYMNDENANISFAMLFGEKEGIDKNISNIFSISGISHILAVSGLHIGVLVAFILFILKICKANKFATFGIMGTILLLYMILCGFTASVVRASIMAMVLLGAKLLGMRYDNLSSLSLAGIIICFINPFAMFQVGFQLSFACVFAIITLVPVFDRMFEKIHFKNKLSGSLSISMATSIALIPFCAHYFGRISLLTAITNVFVIPIFSVTYVLLFVITLVGVLLNFVGVILVIPDILIHVIKVIANFVANLRYSYVIVFDVSMITFILVFALQYIIEFMVTKRIIKLVVIGILIIGLSISMIFDFVPYRYNENSVIYFNQYYGNMVVMLNDNEDVTIIGFNSKDYDRLCNVLSTYHINRVDNIILYDTDSNIDDIDTFIHDYKVNNIYTPKAYEMHDDIDNINKVDGVFNVGSYTYEYISDNGVGVVVRTSRGYNIIGDTFSRDNLVYISNKYYKDICDISVSSMDREYSDILDYNNIISQESGEFFANIVLNNQKIWYSNI